MGLCGLLTGVISGHLQEYLGYVSYFVFVMVATIPSFLACWFAPFNLTGDVLNEYSAIKSRQSPTIQH